MSLYVLEERVRSKGWELIASTHVQGDGVQAPGYITLCHIPGAHPFVVHFLNVQDGGFHSGDYCKDDVSARRVFAHRSERYTRHHRKEPI